MLKQDMVAVQMWTCYLPRASCPFFPSCLTVAATLAFVQALAGSYGFHMGGGLRNSRNVLQLLTALHSLPVTCPCDFLQNYVKRNVEGEQQRPDQISKDSWTPAMLPRSNSIRDWGWIHRRKPVVTTISNQGFQWPVKTAT